MAHCYNCGTDMSDEDRTRLCDDCKKIILPFIKFMDASTSSAVRRLVSNEENLRNAGVTDGGMEYLLRICELHDKSKAEASGEESGADYEDDAVIPAEDEVSDEEETDGDGEWDEETYSEPDEMADESLRDIFDDEDDRPKMPKASAAKTEKEKNYSDIEVPLDKPLRLIRKGYGQYMAAAEIVLGIVAALLIVWFFIDLLVLSRVDFAALGTSLISLVMIYVTDSVRKLLYDIETVKKHFR